METLDIDDVRDARIERLARIPLDGNDLIDYQEVFLPNLITIGHLGSSRYVRITDGRSVLVKDGGRAYAADEAGLAIVSRAEKMIGNEYVEEVALYDWPHETARSADLTRAR